jgi:hypothetical protein
MRSGYVAFILAGGAVGCGSQTTLRANLPARQTPLQWTNPATVRFDVFDSKKASMGTFTLRLTTEPAKTCIAGDWFRAEPIDSNLRVLNLTQWWSDKSMTPSYQITGRLLTVELNGGGLCDAYTEVRAEISEDGGRGFLATGGIFGGSTYGNVVIRRLP